MRAFFHTVRVIVSFLWHGGTLEIRYTSKDFDDSEIEKPGGVHGSSYLRFRMD